jgi:hypothetical protein
LLDELERARDELRPKGDVQGSAKALASEIREGIERVRKLL